MKKIILFLSIVFTVILFSSLNWNNLSAAFGENSSVLDTMVSFGADLPNHMPDKNVAGASAEKGEEIVKRGITAKPSGKGETKKQSNHFVCTSCHNVEKEDPDLANTSPEARLKYVSEKGLPFLQGTTLYGAVNRSSFYNDDYEKKYGELVEPTRNNLREAIQLCAVECSQGRILKDWELESVLRYLWTLELKMGDLKLSQAEYKKLDDYRKSKSENKAAVELIQSKFQKGAPAHFVTPPENRKKGYGLTGNPENGKLIYELSCLHCHEHEVFSSYNLDHSKDTFKYLKKHFKKYTRYSVYQVARYGTSPLPGKRAYMPQYTKEKMSDQQMEDLRAYIEQEARRN